MKMSITYGKSNYSPMSDEQSTNCELCFRPSEGEICQLCFSIVNENQTISANLIMNPNQIEDGLKLIPEIFTAIKIHGITLQDRLRILMT